ncbi:hypothetical protein D3C72_1520840 [compost metagenome]
MLCERHGDPDTLPLPAGKLVHRTLGKFDRIGGGESRGDGLVILPRPAGEQAVMRVPATADEIGNHDALRRDRRLRQKAHAPCEVARRETMDRLSIKQNLTGARRDEPRHAAQQGGLAAGIGADNDGDFPAWDGEIQPFNDEVFAISGRKTVHGKGVAGHNEPPLRLTRTIR